MNIIQKVTLRYMQKNRRRVIVTLIGVIISVAMMTAVSIAGNSFWDMLRRDYVNTYGKWHVIYRDVPVKNMDIITGDKRIGSYLLSADIGYDLLENGQNPNKPYLFCGHTALMIQRCFQ